MSEEEEVGGGGCEAPEKYILVRLALVVMTGVVVCFCYVCVCDKVLVESTCILMVTHGLLTKEFLRYKDYVLAYQFFSAHM